MSQQHRDSIPISARTGRGLEHLVEHVRGEMRGGLVELRLDVPLRDGKAIHFLESRATVLGREYHDQRAVLTVRIGNRQLDQLRAMGTEVREVGTEGTETEGRETGRHEGTKGGGAEGAARPMESGQAPARRHRDGIGGTEGDDAIK